MRRLFLVVIFFLSALSAVWARGPQERHKRLTFAVLEDDDKGEDLHHATLDFDAMRDLGVDTWPGSFGWDDYETAPGMYVSHEIYSATILFGGLVWPEAQFMKEGCGDYHNGATFDVLPFHAYPKTWTPHGVEIETYFEKYPAKFLPGVAGSCGVRPVWINESGFGTTPGTTEIGQSR